MRCLKIERICIIAICLMLSSTSKTHAQLKKSVHSHQEQGIAHINDAENPEKDTHRLQTIEGKVKPPSPKVRVFGRAEV